MDPSSCILYIFFLLCSGYCASAETAFTAVSKVRLRTMADKGNKRARKALWVCDRFDKTLTTILIGNNVFHAACASLSALLVLRQFQEEFVVYGTLITTLIVYLFAEMIPKSLAKARSEEIALLFAGSMVFFVKLLTPVSALFAGISSLLSRIFASGDTKTVTEEDLINIIETIEDEGVLEPEQQELLNSAMEFREKIAAGEVQVTVGTHALLTEATQFENLGLVIADEQHRFGVAQRSKLSSKGEDPHLLVMSATPIPRTLALLMYGDLEVSILDERPPGREDVDTFLVNESYRPRINAFIRKHVSEGHQCFVVCPAVEESEELGIKAATVWAETLQQTVFPDLRIALLHGQMKGAEKEAAMASFARGEADVMVATTVIEVGVDVPNATLMVIEDADRFGLSQLHQLRGRVGRGQAKSYCIMTSHNRNPETLQRLKALCKTTDGFKIAEEDLKLRGPGDFFGSRQSGLPAFRVADLSFDLETLKEAQGASARWIEEYGSTDRPEAKALRERVAELFQRAEGTMN